jgi:hypothetical protein
MYTIHSTPGVAQRYYIPENALVKFVEQTPNKQIL